MKTFKIKIRMILAPVCKELTSCYFHPYNKKAGQKEN